MFLYPFRVFEEIWFRKSETKTEIWKFLFALPYLYVISILFNLKLLKMFVLYDKVKNLFHLKKLRKSSFDKSHICFASFWTNFCYN